MAKSVRFEDYKDALSFVKKHIGEVDDPILLILKSHLLIETFLNSFIQKFFQNPKAVLDARLSFRQTLLIVKALHGYGEKEWLWEAIDRLNRLRNDLAHNIEPESFDSNLRSFVKKTEEHIDLEKYSRAEKLRMTLLILCGVVYNLKPQ